MRRAELLLIVATAPPELVGEMLALARQRRISLAD